MRVCVCVTLCRGMGFERRVFRRRIFELMPAGLSVCSEEGQGHAAVVLLILLPSICLSQIAASLMQCPSSLAGVPYARGQAAAVVMVEADEDDCCRWPMHIICLLYGFGVEVWKTP